MENSDEPPDEEKAKRIIDKYYVKKIVHENGQKSFVDFKMGDSIEEFQNLGEGIYMYFCFLKYFGLVFLFIGLLMLLPVILMILETGHSNEAKSNIFFRTMIANVDLFQKVDDQEITDKRLAHIVTLFTLLMWFYFSINILLFLSIVIFRIIVKRKRISLRNINKEQRTSRSRSSH